MNKKDLAKKIWEASDNLRGKIDANAYKDFKMTGELPVNYDFGG